MVYSKQESQENFHKEVDLEIEFPQVAIGYMHGMDEDKNTVILLEEIYQKKTIYRKKNSNSNTY